jgi:hypothetical protein
VQTREPGCSLDKAMRTLGSGRSQGWSGVGRSDLDSKAGSPQARSGYEDWPGPTFPGWSVGRARLTLNQD